MKNDKDCKHEWIPYQWEYTYWSDSFGLVEGKLAHQTISELICKFCLEKREL